MSFMNTSRAFRRGFVDGFTAPFTILSGRRLRFSHGLGATASDAAAWREIGSLLNSAYREVGEEIGEIPDKAPSKDPGRFRRAG